MELYQNDLRDLLLHPSERNSAQKLVIRRDGKGVVYVEGVTVREAESQEDLTKILTSGLKHRSVAGTRMNTESSRSHLIFCVLIETVNKRTQRTTLGKLTLVDLAGSERVSRSGVKGQGLKEATVSCQDRRSLFSSTSHTHTRHSLFWQAINQSLSALGDVISALTSKKKHIPYRNHKLTMLMSDSLGGNAKTLMIVNISPADDNVEETLSSLEYAQRVKQIKNKTQANVDSAQVRALKQEVVQVSICV